MKVYKSSRTVPDKLKDAMKLETFEKARLYGLDRQNFGFFKSILMDVIIGTLELYFGIFAFMWHQSVALTQHLNLNHHNEIIVSCIFICVISVVGIVKDMPFKVYSTFVVEEKHGFNKQTVGFFVKDQIKFFILNIALSVPISSMVIYIVQIGGTYFFVWIWLFVSVVSFILMAIYPSWIAPLFDKYRPLDAGPLRTSIEDLAASMKFPLGQLYVVEGSKRSAHSNAYFYGLWGLKRIVLFDTLLINKGAKKDESKPEDEQALKESATAEPTATVDDDKTDEDAGKGCEDSEVLAVLGHELGHWKLGHFTKNIIIGQVHLFLMFAAFGNLFQYEPLYRAVGFGVGERPILVGLLLIFSYILAAYSSLISFGMTVLSRKFEYQADDFAKGLGFSKELSKALIKLNIDNLGFPVSDWMYSAWNHSHPTILQRMSRLEETDSQLDKKQK